MRLVSFSLSNFRSITRTERLSLDSFTVLVGPNNEGKSNILLGLVSGMKLLSLHNMPPARTAAMLARRVTIRASGMDIYKAGRDLPLHLQERPAAKTTFDFEFELTDQEIAEFKVEVKSNLNGRLPVRLTASAESIQFEVRKQGRGAATLSAKAAQISRFIATRIDVKDIPAVRTARDSVELVRAMVEREISELEKSEEYRKAVERIAELQAPVLTGLEKALKSSLGKFIPDLNSVEVIVSDRLSALRKNCQVIVDDGTATELRYKGDGIQSLAAMSLIHHLAQQGSINSGMVLAVEEPEAHLHPRAIHYLRDTLLEISERQQVVITTHSPLFVNRADVPSNVIVNNNKARPARTVAEIRDVLGVRVSDNLSAARVVLLVEGVEDKRAIVPILRDSSKVLEEAMDSGALVVECLRGAGNLGYQASLFKSQLCLVHVFMDNDKAATDAAAKSISLGGLEYSEISHAMFPGMKESEIEDLYKVSAYQQVVIQNYSVTFPTAQFNKRRSKWSERMKRAFLASGQQWSDSIEASVKSAVAESVERDPGNAVDSAAGAVIKNLCAVLERKLGT
ncbi:ATP-dependent endonuclease [Streptomyces sp. NBC_00687]|uniref:ATP-dependent nuclease n=1 Tax=Streptomyces sp. NBC_00687 TaxID=2975807 RepID=UPI00225BB9EA|nr:ATP-binding protein [Streptomyces sp. NBC_00687]MCX4915307.1 AAA family ATPase [Streptomyces sp. NBC_00687]